MTSGTAAFLLLLLLVSASAAAGVGGARELAVPPASTAIAAHVPSTGVPSPAGHHPPGLKPVGGSHAYGSSPYYTQVGATLSELNGSYTQTGLQSVSLRLPLVASPYPIGYELNGLSNSGDWYQVLVGDNWPGCPGYEMLYEVWSTTGGYPPGCDTSLSLRTGDLLQLGLNYTSGGGVCLDLWDVSRSTEHSICTAQPDAGGSEFVTLSSASNTNGYFTGPMTEIANSSAASCPDYRYMPTVSYAWPSSERVSTYQSWSDEFLSGTSVICYTGGGTVSIGTNDPTTHYVDTASGTSYGPHYVAGQNYTFVNPAYGFRVLTDPTPLTGVSLAASSSLLTVGSSSTLTATVSGGVSPYNALWSLNGSLLGVGGLVRNFTGAAPGAYRFSAYGVDADSEVVGPSNTVTVQVNAPLSASNLRVNTTSGGADVGESVRISVVAAGGLPGYTYVWSGLPPECPPSNSAALDCVPNHAASYSLSVQVTDTNHTVVSAGPIAFVVSPALVPSLRLSTGAIDLNQSVGIAWSIAGGAGRYSTVWTGLPAGCAAPSGSAAACVPSVAGSYGIAVTVSDSNGASATSPTVALVVHPFLTAVLGIDRTIIDAGVNATISARVLGGSAPYTFGWSGLPDGCPAANLSALVCAPFTGGTFSVTLVVTDILGGTTTSPALVFFVYSALNVSVSGGTATVVGASLDLQAVSSGGSPGVVLHWSGLPDGCSPPTGTHLVCTPTTAGSYNITIVATDGGGGSASYRTTIYVAYPPATAGGISPLLLLGIVGGVIVVAGIVAAALATRSRRRRPRVR